MSTLYKVKLGEVENCGSCGKDYEGGQQMVRLTDPYGSRLGVECLECYDEGMDLDEKWGV